MYGKLFSTAFEGSMFGSGPLMFAVWSYVLSHAHRKTSTVELNARLIAAIIGKVTPADVEEVIEAMCSPDPASRTQTEDGRKLIRQGVYQFRVVNLTVYDRLANEEARREYFRLQKQAQRARSEPEWISPEELAEEEDDEEPLEPMPATRTETPPPQKDLPTHAPTPEIDVAAAIHAKTEASGMKVPPPPQLVVAWIGKYGADLITETMDDCLGQLSGKHFNYLAAILATRNEDPSQRPANRRTRPRPVVSPDGPANLCARADEVRETVHALESALKYPDWDRGDCSREQAQLYLLHVRTNFAADLDSAPTLTEWLARQA